MSVGISRPGLRVSLSNHAVKHTHFSSLHRVAVCFEKGYDMEEYAVIAKKSQVYNAGVVGGYTDTVCPRSS